MCRRSMMADVSRCLESLSAAQDDADNVLGRLQRRMEERLQQRRTTNEGASANDSGVNEGSASGSVVNESTSGSVVNECASSVISSIAPVGSCAASVPDGTMLSVGVDVSCTALFD